MQFLEPLLVAGSHPRRRYLWASEYCRLAVRILGMGGLNSPAIAQQTHLEAVASMNIAVQDFMRWGAPLPLNGIYAGVFYDDLVAAAKVPVTQVHCRAGPDLDIMEASERAYVAANLPTSSGKGFGFASGSEAATADLQFTAWGTQVSS